MRNLAVQCLSDGIRLVLVNRTYPFGGRIFVQGQNDNPHCSKTFGPLDQQSAVRTPHYFHIPAAHCNMELEGNNVVAVTVISQEHPTFVTEKSYSYRLRCTYPTPTLTLRNQVNVSELTTVQSFYRTGPEPTCSLKVTNERNSAVESATVGDVLKLSLAIHPNETYAILPEIVSRLTYKVVKVLINRCCWMRN
uniref:ZP domain-containing protein n=1 Tax=Ditylenchus dipsaci TaxID=166011 RepID=A0A915CUF3_9BILA